MEHMKVKFILFQIFSKNKTKKVDMKPVLHDVTSKQMLCIQDIFVNGFHNFCVNVNMQINM